MLTRSSYNIISWFNSTVWKSRVKQDKTGLFNFISRVSPLLSLERNSQIALFVVHDKTNCNQPNTWMGTSNTAQYPSLSKPNRHTRMYQKLECCCVT